MNIWEVKKLFALRYDILFKMYLLDYYNPTAFDVLLYTFEKMFLLISYLNRNIFIFSTSNLYTYFLQIQYRCPYTHVGGQQIIHIILTCLCTAKRNEDVLHCLHDLQNMFLKHKSIWHEICWVILDTKEESVDWYYIGWIK